MTPPEHDTEHGTEHGTEHDTEHDTEHGTEHDTEHDTEHGTEHGDHDYGDYGRLDGLGWSWDEAGDGGPFYGPEGEGSDEPLRTASQLYEESKNASLAEMLEEMSSYFWENIVANGHFPEHLATDEIDNMLQFMEDLYKILPTARERVVSEARLHLEPALTVELLQLQYPYLDWERYLSGVTRRPVRGSDPVHVRYPRYMQQLGDLLDRYHPSVVQNAVLLRFRTVFLAEMVDSLVSADTSLPAGQQLCVSLTKEAFPVAVAALYVRNVGKQRVDLLREKVSSILEEIRSELLRSIELKMAASNATRTASDRLLTLAQDKIAATRTYLLAPENLWNDTFVNVNTPPVSRLWKTSPQSPRVLVRPGSKMLLDLFRGLRRAQVKLLKLTLREMASTDPLRWPTEVEPHTANAFHLPARNAVGVPLALLTEPFFHGDVPEYVQFAVLGVVMAHELLHGIDSTGLSFDETGAARHLPAALQQTADEKFQCIRTEYVTPLVKTASSVHQSVDVQLDGDLTLGENSADFSSLSLALSAYLRRRARLGPEPALPGVNLTTQQAFFMSFAQVYCADIDVDSYAALVAASTHPPNPERVNRMARHTAEFAATFSCRPGTPMNPETRCAPLW
ncbi:endothelin-converting enzyme 2-like [Amphibalanus amphitrite]|uniref:endothelin-converting enzyme 2-like n=1 Tax=Amphibalanus amphitrite TaxID=1232801 RepID=UPI001C92A473|nr:endothelin-converting enzyme 2-like [Amphibalanus amphitrite]